MAVYGASGKAEDTSAPILAFNKAVIEFGRGEYVSWDVVKIDRRRLNKVFWRCMPRGRMFPAVAGNRGGSR